MDFKDKKQLLSESSLFDTEWYRKKYRDVRLCGLSPEAHYLTYGWRLGRDPSPSFSTKGYLAENPDVKNSKINPLLHFLLYGKKEGRPLIETSGVELRVLIKENKINKALKHCEENLICSPNDEFMLSLKASLVGRISGWKESGQYWQDYWSKFQNGDLRTNKDKRVMFQATSLNNNFEKININKVVKTSNTSKKVCIYTSLFGSYDSLQPVTNFAENIDYICFTDQNLTTEGWTIIKSDCKYENLNLCAKEFKILPHKYLSKYDASLFIDASTFIYFDISPLINRFLLDEKFVMFRHPDRNDAFDEAEAVLVGLRHSPKTVVDQISHYQSEGLPRGTGLFEASFIWRNHKNKEITKLMNLWWNEINSYSNRDQLSLCYLVWKTGIKPTVFSKEFGTPRINPYFFKMPHNSGKKPEIEIPNDASITFLYHAKHKNVASTKMRGEQLVDIVIRNSDLNINYQSDINVKNKCIFLTKGLLKEIKPEELSRLQSDNYFVAADYVDDIPRKDIHQYIDIYIASSIKGYYQLLHTYTDKWVFMITHHLDPRLECSNSEINSLEIGYFGETINALHHEKISNMIDIHHIDTKQSSTSWLDAIKKYNLHYAVRAIRDIDGNKPFLKGFTASNFNANILIHRFEGDAMYYLPPDYPFFVESTSLKEIKSLLQSSKKLYGNDPWKYGLEAMKIIRTRCSNEYVFNELKSILDFFQKNN